MRDTLELMDFIERSPSPFHAVDNMRKGLLSAGFEELDERKRFSLRRGKNYFVVRNSSALAAFRIPEDGASAFSIISAHTDSPSFKVKPDPEMPGAGLYTLLNTEGYGGMLMAPWFDRPLSIAGRAFVRNGSGVEEHLVDFGRDLVSIVNLAIHMNRKANEGIAYSAQKDMLPLFAEGIGKGRFAEALASLISADKDDILGYDLFLYSREKGSVWGLNNEFFSATKIDDLGCAHSAYRALAECGSRNSGNVPMIVLFDNEETGSGSRQGALSDFLLNTVTRICLSLGMDEEERMMAAVSSRMLSADNGHAVHPNHQEKADPTNRPRLNGGVLLKHSANQKYTTDGESGSFVKALMFERGIPFQEFANNSDIPGGSTLGNLSGQKISIPAADVGIAELAMHSPYETAGVRDTSALLDLFRAFLSL